MAYTRKDVSTLTRTEKRRFVNALLEIKRRGEYDEFVRTHIEYYVSDGENGLRTAHMAPSFLPWHRRFLLDLEEALRRVDPSVTVPYWDWTKDRSAKSAPWTADLLGGTGRRSDHRVTTGPFAHAGGNWTIKVNVTDTEYLTRDLGRAADPLGLPTKSDLEWALDDPKYDTSPYDSTVRKGSATSWRGGGRAAAACPGATTTGSTAGSAGPWSAAPPSTTRCSGCTTPSSTSSGPAGRPATAAPATCPPSRPAGAAHSADGSSHGTRSCRRGT